MLKSVVIGHLSALLLRDNSFVFKISLIANKDKSYLVLPVTLNVAHPLVNGVERFAVRYVIHQYDTVCPRYVVIRHLGKALLARQIKNPKVAHRLVVH